MTEKDLIELGFQCESDPSGKWYYYILEFTEHTTLVSTDNEQAEKLGKWEVQLFDNPNLQWSEKKHVKELIKVINKGKL